MRSDELAFNPPATTDLDFDFDPVKKCSKCKKWKPATAEHFYVSTTTSDGWSFRCIDCQRKLSVNSAAAKRQEMGEVAWKAYRKEIAQRHAGRVARGEAPNTAKLNAKARQEATKALIAAHAEEFAALLEKARTRLTEDS
jgi:hypothetical protein